MTRQQLAADSDNDYDPEDPDDELARLAHYQLHGNKPRLMPDLSRAAADLFSSTFGIER